MSTIHHTAEVSPGAVIGANSRIWHEAQVRERAEIGSGCTLGKGVYVDFDVHIGNDVKIQNRASIYHGTSIEDGVFIGPHVVFTNDTIPRAINPDGSPKTDDDWSVEETTVRYGASVGAGSIILPGVEIGRFALVGAGAVVTKSVPDHAIVVGNPARVVGYACICGHRLTDQGTTASCSTCGAQFEVSRSGTGQFEIVREGGR